MKMLLDECVPWPMHKLLSGHVCSTVQEKGWGGIKNGDLLQRAEGEFDLFITSDQNLRYQQNLIGRRIVILELSTNDIGRIQAASALVQEAVDKIGPNEFSDHPLTDLAKNNAKRDAESARDYTLLVPRRCDQREPPKRLAIGAVAQPSGRAVLS